MRKILTSFTLLVASLAFAQVGVNNEDPQATLHIDAKAPSGTSTNIDGILIPRVDRARAQRMSGVKESTLIYVNALPSGTQTGRAQDIDTEGFYYYQGTGSSAKWVKLGVNKNIYSEDGSIDGGNRVVTQNNNNVTYTTGTTGEFIIDGTSRLNGGSYVKTTVVGSSTNTVTTYEVQPDDYYIAVQSATPSVRVDIPLPQDAVGRVLIISNDAATDVAIFSGGDQALSGTDSPSVGINHAMWIISDGKRWYNLINY